MSKNERGISSGGPDSSAEKPPRTRVRVVLYSDDEPPPFNEDAVNLYYDASELERLGGGDFDEGLKRLKTEVEFGGRTADEIEADPDNRPLQDELDLLPPPFQVPEPRPN
ncbi:MAG: hypothetical protein AAB520_03870 [Patescibacteria group bacterium]